MSDIINNTGSAPRALFVTTVPITLRAFLYPLAHALRAEGWQVDALTGQSHGPQDGSLKSDACVLTASQIEEPGLSEAVSGPRPVSDSDNSSNAELWSCVCAEAFGRIHSVGWSRSLRSFLKYRELASKLRAIVLEGEYRVVHTHTPIASLITRYALRKVSGVVVIYTAHGFHFYKGQKKPVTSWFYQRAEQFCTRYTDYLVVMNDEDEAAAQAMVRDVPRCKVVRIDGVGIEMSKYTPTALAPEREAELRAKYRLPAGSFVVGMIAEINENKRHRLALDAAGLLRESHPRIHWIFMGTGTLEDELRRRAQNEGLPVTFTGQIKRAQLQELFSLIDLGLLVSEREGLPRSLMEFTAAGIPIAGTRTRGIADEVRDECAIASAGTGAAIAEVVARIADDFELAAGLAQEQHAYARTHYTMDVILPQYLALYAESLVYLLS